MEPALRRKLMLLTAPQQLVAFDLSEGKLYPRDPEQPAARRATGRLLVQPLQCLLGQRRGPLPGPTYEREAIRPHVLGKFRDLLEATAKSPAMLFFLDNWESVGATAPAAAGNAKRPVRGLNENYARELMELHTLGVDGGYTQKDVTEVARCFTGWTIRLPRQGGDFFYNDRVHDKGEKIVLGVTILAGGGKEDAEKVLDILARHPATARLHFAGSSRQRFVADDPPQKLIDKMAKTFRDKEWRHP